MNASVHPIAKRHKNKSQIIAAIQCRLAELRQPPFTYRKRILSNELRQLLKWIRTGKVRVR